MAKQRIETAGGAVSASGATAGLIAPAPRCGNCRFWKWAGGDAETYSLGSCRRYPPVSGIKRATAAGPLTLHPVTEIDDWCGEHKPSDT